ncbi:MAG: 2-hydroxychromene-2-carboxylate isomerase [Candidatus Binatia bacterium]
MRRPRIVHYFDYKSPYAYLAQPATDELARELAAHGMVIERLPYTLDVSGFLGAARLDESGRDVLGTRTAHQWRRVRYAYLDCRREASRRGLIIRGPRKVFDSSIAHIGFLWAERAGRIRPYHDRVFEKFWKRELEIEDRAAIAAELERAGVDTAGFDEYLSGDGRSLHDRLRAEAEAKGVFGVPAYLVDDELFWGNERIERVHERVLERLASS